MSTSPDDVEDDLNIVEDIISAASASDEYEAAQLRLLQRLVEAQTGKTSGTVNGADLSDLPNGLAGVATEPIDSGTRGEALFEIGGSKAVAFVKATSAIDEDEGVVVVGQNNNVRPAETEREKFSFSSLGSEKVGGSSKAERFDVNDIAIAINEETTSKGLGVDDENKSLDFDGDLAAGDEQVVAQVATEASLEKVVVSSVGATGHKADIDGDGQDESVVQYRYEVQTGNGWEEVKKLRSVVPYGSLATPEQLVPDGRIDATDGFRIKLKNRTDDGAFTQITVPQEDLGGIIKAGMVEVDG